MRTDISPTIRLSEYQPPAYLVDQVDLTFRLAASSTRVLARIAFRANPARAGDTKQALALDGVELKLLSAAIDGADVMDKLTVDAAGLSLNAAHLPDGPFIWEAEVEIDPAANTALEGLYMSKGMYCSQCEAEGFRKITYYPDRPDVMSVFSVRIEGDVPVMLSNGNLTAQGDGFVQWHDPWPKPAYLFALVAGDLVSFDDTFTTMSGRKVDLKIYVRPGDEDKCAYAMDSLKRSMVWDEQAYGRAYDLDLFMIVAVDDFNMGAMENKGLNVFNSKYVLASPETATDTDYALIEGIIAHEYFHNWTGNRITCRDWFQLCLKEGLTVFRDQQFSAHERSEAVQRISDVKQLRARQFQEDGGPLAHPVRPEEYIEINNFYTATVYEKGAEVIRMLHSLIGPEQYRRGTDLYFERHDGQACTIEQWIKVFEDTTGRDLSHFAQWYAQAGTPEVTAQEHYEDGTYSLTLTQKTKPTPGQPTKKPQVIPMAYGFLQADGAEIGTPGLIELSQETQTFTFDMPSRPVASLFRGFSAPVKLVQELSSADRALLLAHDSDPFNRWEAGHKLGLDTLVAMVAEGADADPVYLDALANLAADGSVDPAFKAMVLGIPSEDEVAQTLHAIGLTPDPDLIAQKSEALYAALAHRLGDQLQALYDGHGALGAYAPDAASAGRRSLKNRALSLMSAIDPHNKAASAQFANADNMTDSISALSQLVHWGNAKEALAVFHKRWHTNPNVLDKWFSLQGGGTKADRALDVVKSLTQHPDFTWKTPNRYRALIGSFAFGNPAGFHRKDGAGYAFVTDWLLKLDPLNPQTTARLTTAFESWRLYDAGRQELMRAQLQRMAATPDLSKDAREMVERILAA